MLPSGEGPGAGIGGYGDEEHGVPGEAGGPGVAFTEFNFALQHAGLGDTGAFNDRAVGFDDRAKTGWGRLKHPPAGLNRSQLRRCNLLGLHDGEPERRTVRGVELDQPTVFHTAVGAIVVKNLPRDADCSGAHTGFDNGGAGAWFGIVGGQEVGGDPFDQAAKRHEFTKRNPAQFVVTTRVRAIGVDRHRCIQEETLAAEGLDDASDDRRVEILREFDNFVVRGGFFDSTPGVDHVLGPQHEVHRTLHVLTCFEVSFEYRPCAGVGSSRILRSASLHDRNIDGVYSLAVRGYDGRQRGQHQDTETDRGVSPVALDCGAQHHASNANKCNDG